MPLEVIKSNQIESTIQKLHITNTTTN